MTFDRRITPSRPDLADERLRGQVEAERFAAGMPMRVAVPCASLHRHPSREAPVDTQAIMGEAVTVYDEHEGWSWAQLHDDGYVGYLPSIALDRPGPEPTHRVGALRTFVYPGPNLKLPDMGFLTLNSKVAVTDRDGHARYGDDLLLLPRINVGGESDLATFGRKLDLREPVPLVRRLRYARARRRGAAWPGRGAG